MNIRIPCFVQIIALLLIFTSCTDDDDNTGFIDQQLAGEIAGAAYTSSSGGGYAVDWTFDAARADITIGGATINDPCSYSHDGPEISFIVPKEVGTYPLDEDWVSDASVGQYLVYLFPDGSDQDDFIIVSDGTIEILTVTSESITGRVNAQSDDQNFVNGDFSVSFCQD